LRGEGGKSFLVLEERDIYKVKRVRRKRKKERDRKI
jgi:hypothetical protein